MTRDQELPDILADIDQTNVDITVAPSVEALISEIGRQSLFGGAGKTFFGTAFVQGNRLQFSTAVSIDDMLAISRVHRAAKGATLSDVEQHTNRPAEAKHANKLSAYLDITACRGYKFILPAMTFNYGVMVADDDPGTRATLALLGGAPASATAWPAVLRLPAGVPLETTDGAHRRTAIDGLLSPANVKSSPDDKLALRRNAIPVTIVFETSSRDSHQDFADCATAKPISKSLVAGYDVRDMRNRVTGDLVRTCQFLHHYTDSTSSTVNLSKGSLKVWSMSAVRSFVGYVCDHHPARKDTLRETEQEIAAKVRGVPEYFKQLVLRIPTLQALNAHREERAPDAAPPTLRDQSGGDVAMRAAGMLMFALGYLHCERYGVPYADMARFMGAIDWHMLDCEREAVSPAEGETYTQALEGHTKPHWRPLLTIRGDRYRISASPTSCELAWDMIAEGTLFERPREAA